MPRYNQSDKISNVINVCHKIVTQQMRLIRCCTRYYNTILKSRKRNTFSYISTNFGTYILRGYFKNSHVLVGID